MSRLKARSGLQRFDLPLPEILQPIKKAYGYDKNGELTGRNDSFSGERHYTYDAASNLMATGTDDWSIAPREVRPSDFGGVGFDDGEGLTHARHNRLKELDGFTFTYDAFGRTIEKKHAASHRTWKYTYNSENQLIECTKVTSFGFKVHRFIYDLIGRRIAKTDGRTETCFVWSGMRLLQESKDEVTTTY